MAGVREGGARLPGDPGPQTRAEEAAGSCPWWRRAWARTAAGSQPPGASGLSLQTAGMEKLAPGSPSPGWGCSQWLTHQKVSSKGRSHLWVALAAGSRTQDFKSGSWLHAVLDPWSLRALSASLRLRTSAHQAPFSRAHASHQSVPECL